MGGVGQRAGQMAGQVQQYWKRHRADNPLLRILVYLLAGFALLFQGTLDQVQHKIPMLTA